MKIENIAAEVRPRVTWESVDLGFSMVRHWWKPIFLPWLATMVPFAIVVNLTLWQHPWLALFVLWWTKPLFDRIPLHVVSHALFGEQPNVAQTLRALPRLFRFHFIKALTIHRLDPARSFTLPVWQLEHLSGRKRVQRVRILQKNAQNTAVWLTAACLCFIFIIALGLLLLLLMLVPSDVAETLWYEFSDQRSAWWVAPLSNGFLMAATILIEPFYVAGGFALYLNRRTHLEGWDIELSFRRLAERIRASRGQLATVLLLLAGLSGTVMLTSPALVHAETTLLSREQAREKIDEVFAQPEFNTRKERTGWYAIDPPAEETKEKDAEEDDGETSWWDEFVTFMKALLAVGDVMALLMEVLLWLLVVVLAALLIYFFARWRPEFGGTRMARKRRRSPCALFGMDVRPESLPDDVAGEAWALWQAGQTAEAISLLYRGALVTLIHRDGITLASSATEGDCVRQVRSAGDRIMSETTDYFTRLTLTWQSLAYAHRLPASSTAEQLCQQWPQHFEEQK